MVSLAGCEFCFTQRAQNAQRHASILLRVASGVLDFCPRMARMVTNLLSTDDTDDTVFFASRCHRKCNARLSVSSVQFPYYPLTKRNRAIRGRYISFVFRKLSSLLGSNQRDSGE